MRDREVTRSDLGLLSVLMGVASTVVFYRYGVDNQISELPIVLRAIDPDFLVGDFYTDASAGPGPRYYFARFLAFFANRETLPSVCFSGVVLCNVAIAWITLSVGRTLFAGSVAAAAGAAVLVMSVPAFRLGFADRIYLDQLLASRVAAPLLLAAISFGLRRRPLWAATAAGFAALAHPTFGPEGGVVALVLCAAVSTRDTGSTESWRSLAGAFGLLALFSAAGAIPSIATMDTGALAPEQYLAIETFFRHPHHSLLSAQRSSDLGRTAIFALAVALSLWQWRRVQPSSELLRVAAILLVALPALCILGALAFELFPTRIGALARPLRLLWISKWLGLIVVGGGLFAGRTQQASERQLPAWPAVVACLLVVVNSRMTWGALVCLGICAAASALLLSQLGRSRVRVLLAAVPVMLLAPLYVGTALFPEALLKRIDPLRPTLTESDRSGDAAEVARWARSHTPKTAVFLAPPDFGAFRLAAERALVVDFKSFPFQSAAALEWQQRLFDCYGKPRGVAWDALREMKENHSRLDVVSRVRDRCRYGATHAILDADAPTSLPALFENPKYKVVALPDS